MTSASIFLFSLVTGGSQKRAVAAPALAISMADKTLPASGPKLRERPARFALGARKQAFPTTAPHGRIRLCANTDSVIRSLFPIEVDFHGRAAARRWGQAARQIEGRACVTNTLSEYD